MHDSLRDRLQSALGTSYAIEHELQAGGMSRVFVATDSTLGRRVVVKILDPDLIGSVNLDRFRRETRLAASLQQANIVPVLSAGEVAGLPFYTMPFVEGQNLRQRLADASPIPIRETLAVLRDVARALSFAHERGVVHRDIKPENVLLSGSTAVVTDFGIAKAIESSMRDGPTLTQVGTIVGTPAYMAPEQVAGDDSISHRADLYSFGILAYELFTGSTPFAGRSGAAILAAPLTETPALVATKRDGIPAAIAAIVMRCLEKDPDRRPGRAVEIADVIDGVATSGPVAVARQMPSIVVLPFDNSSPDPDNAFFADGLTDELISELSKIHELRVISRTSSRAFKGTDKTVRVIAGELGVRHVLEGSVRRAGANVRITATLVDANTDSQVWSNRYTGVIDDIFDLQERLALTIASSLRLKLTPEESARLAARPISDPRAYEVYLRARQEAWQLSPEGIGRAIALTNEALAIVGENAMLYATLSCFHSLAYDFGISHDEATIRRAEELAARALSMDGELSMALFATGWARYKRGDLQGLVRYGKLAVAIDRQIDALWGIGFLLAEAGRTEDAIPFADAAASRDPLTFIAHLARSAAALFEGKFEEAVASFEHAARLAPGQAFAHWWLGQAYAFAGRDAEALACFDAGSAATAGLISALSEILACALRGDHDAVLALSRAEPIATVALTDEYYPTNVAAALAFVGETDEALVWLERGINWGFTNDRWLGIHNRLLAPLRSDPRFQTLLDRARKTQREFVV